MVRTLKRPETASIDLYKAQPLPLGKPVELCPSAIKPFPSTQVAHAKLLSHPSVASVPEKLICS